MYLQPKYVQVNTGYLIDSSMATIFICHLKAVKILKNKKMNIILKSIVGFGRWFSKQTACLPYSVMMWESPLCSVITVNE